MFQWIEEERKRLATLLGTLLKINIYIYLSYWLFQILQVFILFHNFFDKFNYFLNFHGCLDPSRVSTELCIYV